MRIEIPLFERCGRRSTSYSPFFSSSECLPLARAVDCVNCLQSLTSHQSCTAARTGRPSFFRCRTKVRLASRRRHRGHDIVRSGTLWISAPGPFNDQSSLDACASHCGSGTRLVANLRAPRIGSGFAVRCPAHGSFPSESDTLSTLRRFSRSSPTLPARSRRGTINFLPSGSTVAQALLNRDRRSRGSSAPLGGNGVTSRAKIRSASIGETTCPSRHVRSQEFPRSLP